MNLVLDDKELEITMRLEDEGHVTIMYNNIDVAYISNLTGGIISIVLCEDDVDKLEDLGVYISDNGCIGTY